MSMFFLKYFLFFFTPPKKAQRIKQPTRAEKSRLARTRSHTPTQSQARIHAFFVCQIVLFKQPLIQLQKKRGGIVLIYIWGAGCFKRHYFNSNAFLFKTYTQTCI